MIAQLFRAGGQIVRIDANAVTADQARLERQEVPLGAGGFQHFLRADTQTVANDRQFVHQSDVDVTLRVFDDLGSFGHHDRGRTMQTGGNDLAVHMFDAVGAFLVLGSDNLDDGVNAVDLVARIDTFRRIAQLEILALRQARILGDLAAAQLFGQARIDRGFKDDQRRGRRTALGILFLSTSPIVRHAPITGGQVGALGLIDRGRTVTMKKSQSTISLRSSVIRPVVLARSALSVSPVQS